MVKGIVVTAAIVLLVIFGYQYISKHATPKLTPDGFNLYKTEKDLVARLPYAKTVYVGTISQPFPATASREGAKYFIKMVVSPEVPTQAFADRLKTLAAQDKSENNAAKYQKMVQMTQASVKMRVPIIKIENGAGETCQYSPNIGRVANAYQDLFSVFTGKEMVVFDLMDNHKFTVANYSTVGGDINFEFDKDFTTCKIKGTKGKISGELKRANQLEKFDLYGYQHINFKLISFGLGSTPETYCTDNQIFTTAQAFFKPGENFRVGKIFLRNNTYDLIGYKDRGYYRLFAGNKHFIQVRQGGQKSTSNLAYDFGRFADSSEFDAIYLSEIAKANLPAGKEDEMASNFDLLGNAPVSDTYSPESWTHYEKIEPHLTDYEEILRDDDLWNAFKNQPVMKNFLQFKHGVNTISMSYNPDAARAKILGGKSAAGPSDHGAVPAAKRARPVGENSPAKKKKNTLNDIM